MSVSHHVLVRCVHAPGPVQAGQLLRGLLLRHHRHQGLVGPPSHGGRTHPAPPYNLTLCFTLLQCVLFLEPVPHAPGAGRRRGEVSPLLSFSSLKIPKGHHGLFVVLLHASTHLG